MTYCVDALWRFRPHKVLNFLLPKTSFCTRICPVGYRHFWDILTNVRLDHRVTGVSSDTEITNCLRSTPDDENIDIACLYWFHDFANTNVNAFSNFLINCYFFFFFFLWDRRNPSVLQHFQAYYANPALVPPFICRGAPRQTAWETSISERRNYERENGRSNVA
jgi:hypothetical protein